MALLSEASGIDSNRAITAVLCISEPKRESDVFPSAKKYTTNQLYALDEFVYS